MKRDFDRILVVGAGRLGRAIAPALRNAGFSVSGPLTRDEFPSPVSEDDVVLLCVPDHAITSVASKVGEGAVVGHCSGALALEALAGHEHAFSLHPLLSVLEGGTDFTGAACAIAGRTERSLRIARALAGALGMEPVHVPDARRALYHAAASMASNYLVTIEDAADQLAQSAGIERRQLARLAQSALDNWTDRGGRDALTGPIVRRDEATVARQRAAVEREAPDLLPLWDALAEATRRLAQLTSEDS